MDRRSFVKHSVHVAAGSSLYHYYPDTVLKDVIIGHNDYQYKVDVNWGALNHSRYPVQDCHEMVIDSKGRVLLLTNHTQNNVLIYDQKGTLIESWGNEYPGAHGLTLHDENGKEFLYISDNNRHEVIKTDLKGNVMMTLAYPKDSGKYKDESSYIPTETAIADNGDIYVADGYGSQYIIHYSAQGELLNIFGGRGSEPHHFKNAHGICVDNRSGTPTLLITEREDNQLKRFSLSGELLDIIDLPGAYICRPVIDDDEVYLATIWSGDKASNSGFISVLDKDNRLISAPGGIEPIYDGDQLRPMRQALKVFKHPHDVCIDQDKNLYVAQWNADGVYPIKLMRQ